MKILYQEKEDAEINISSFFMGKKERRMTESVVSALYGQVCF